MLGPVRGSEAGVVARHCVCAAVHTEDLSIPAVRSRTAREDAPRVPDVLEARLGGSCVQWHFIFSSAEQRPPMNRPSVVRSSADRSWGSLTIWL